MLSSALCERGRTWGNGMELCQGQVGLSVRERFFTRGWSGSEQSPQGHGVMAPGCWSSRTLWTMLSGIEFEWPCVELGDRLSDPCC